MVRQDEVAQCGLSASKPPSSRAAAVAPTARLMTSNRNSGTRRIGMVHGRRRKAPRAPDSPPQLASTPRRAREAGRGTGCLRLGPKPLANMLCRTGQSASPAGPLPGRPVDPRQTFFAAAFARKPAASGRPFASRRAVPAQAGRRRTGFRSRPGPSAARRIGTGRSSGRAQQPRRPTLKIQLLLQAAFGPAILFFTSPTMAVKIAPVIPPPAIWPISEPISILSAARASAGIRVSRIWPPTPPPIAPAIVLPRVPRLTYAHSTVKCNGRISGAEENLARGLVAEYLSGARVEFVLDRLDIGIGQNRGKHSALFGSRQ